MSAKQRSKNCATERQLVKNSRTSDTWLANTSADVSSNNNENSNEVYLKVYTRHWWTQRQINIMRSDDLRKMTMLRRKSWSVRALRWYYTLARELHKMKENI